MQHVRSNIEIFARPRGRAGAQIGDNSREHRFIVLIELSDEAEGLKALRYVLPDLPHLAPERWMAPLFRPLGLRVDKTDALARHA
jgi:hypothetical protein